MDLFEAKPKRNLIESAVLITLLFSGVFFCIYTPNYLIFKWWARYSSQITIAYWILGMLFLAFKRPRFTMISFVCCAFLCLYLRNTTNPALVQPKITNEPIIKIAQFNLSASNSSPESTISAIKNTGADVISLQEVAHDWSSLLKDSLSQAYPYVCEVEGLDVYSMKLYSRFPFVSCDTFYSNMIPNLVIGFKNPYSNGELYIISSYIAPPIFALAYNDLQRQLDSVASYTRRLNSPVITVGDYNIHASSYEIQQFRKNGGLNDSRRGYRPDRNDGHIALLEVPTDHIFYTSELSCIEFKTISGPAEERLGIKGYYQYVKDSITYRKIK